MQPIPVDNMPSEAHRPALLRVLAGETLDPPPVWLMRQAGRYLPEYRALRARSKSFLEFCYSPAAAAEATLQPIRRFDFDAAILFSDIVVVADGLGAKVEVREGEGPIFDPIRAEDVARLDVARVRPHLAPVYEAVATIRAGLAPEKALIGFAGGPWTVACYMVEGSGKRGFEAPRAWLKRDPKSFDALLGILVEATVEHLAAQIEAGADCVQIFESWAGLLGGEDFRRCIISPTARIAEALKRQHPGVRIVGFPRNAGVMLEEYAEKASVDAVSLDQAVSAAAGRAVQRRRPVQGNLDPALLVAGGEALAAGIRDIRRTYSGGPHVFNLGHGIVPQTPPEHVAGLVAGVRAKP
jgi:uroporphyrinogen decarboxylase